MLRHDSIVNNARLWVDRVEIPDGVRHAAFDASLPHGWMRDGCARGARPARETGADADVRAGPVPGADRARSDPGCGRGPDDAHSRRWSTRTLSRRDLSSWKSAVSGGAQVPEALVRRVEDTSGVDFTIIYGQTECSPVLTNGLPSDSAADKGLTVGKPLPHTEIRIVDPDSLETVPDRHIRGTLGTRVFHDDRLLRHAGKIGRDADRRRLGAHGRPGSHGRARLLPRSSAASRT